MNPEPPVKATAETMVFAVRSDSKKGQAYRVDLLAEGGFGACSCVDWGTRRWPNIKEGAEAGTRETSCKHVSRARRFFLNDLLATMSKKETRK